MAVQVVIERSLPPELLAANVATEGGLFVSDLVSLDLLCVPTKVAKLASVLFIRGMLGAKRMKK